MEEKIYSFGELQKKYKISQGLLEYLNIEIIKKGRVSYITQESLDKVLKFKEVNSESISVDTPKDLEKVRLLLSKKLAENEQYANS